MSWHFSQALEAEYLAGNFLGGEPFVPWKSTPSAPDDSCSGRMKGICHRSPFGMMFVPSTDTLGEVLLTWFRAASPAKIYQSRDVAKGWTVNGRGYGGKWQGSLAKYDPLTSSWRTAQYSLLGGLESYSETWPRWGLMLDGECWEQSTSAHRTIENVSGLWPTPTVCGNYNRKGASKTSGDGLATAVRMWPTPLARDCRTVRGGARSVNALGTEPLITEVAKAEGATDGALNPDWVEWLMGWPIGWTGSAPLEMDKFQQWSRQHGRF